jgi:predicted tellurium resistance membrane protein TerC
VLEFLLDPTIWASLLTLTALEIVLGIDNVIFLSIVTQKLPAAERKPARRIGLLLALGARILFLIGIAWIIGLTAPLFTVVGLAVSWRDVILIVGGLFLLYKATTEIHDTVEGEDGTEAEARRGPAKAAFAAVLVQIVLLDIVFSIDSVLTAIGMAEHLWIMIVAVVIAIGAMLVAAEPMSAFVDRHPTVKMLALAFLLLIGVALIADGLHFHIPREYLYFAIAFSAAVEGLNLLAAARRRRNRAAAEDDAAA